MAFKLPLREDFEAWTTSQVSDFLRQCGMQECAAITDKFGINGYTFVNMTDRELNKFNNLYQPQIQRMVHDLRKNDGGLMQKIKRITNRNPPNVPHRDYKENDDDSDFSDFDEDYEDPNVHSDTETYAVPSEENDDDHYEPPPTDHENIQQPIHFSPSNGGYADKKPQRQLPTLPSTGMNKPTRQLPKPNQTLTRTSQPSLPPPPSNRPLPPPQSLPKPTPNKPFSKPQPQPGPRPQVNLPPPPGKKKTYPKEPIDTNDDEEDYIVPHDDDDDNYIEPTQDRLAYRPPEVNRATKPTTRSPKPPSYPIHDEGGQELYEVPENEAKPSPPLKRDKLPAPRRNSPPKIEQHNDQEFQTSTEPFQNNYPSPVPRMNKMKPPIILQKPGLPSRDTNSNIDKPLAHERPRQASFGSEVNTSAHQPKFPALTPVSKPNFVPRPPEVVNRYPVTPNRNNIPSAAEQEAGVVNKEWYASSCDRKTAEDALQSSCKDGSFLIRKSSGQDSRQPYTLVVFYNRRVYNIPVRYIESSRQYALGREKSGEERFNSVAEMIENHQRTPLVLIDSQNNTKDSTKLKFPVNIP